MKKIIDKIYIAESNSHPGFFAQEYFLPYRWTKFNSIEYIRKDALLEWAKEKQEQMKIEAGGCSNMLAAGKLLAYEEIIKKIELL